MGQGCSNGYMDIWFPDARGSTVLISEHIRVIKQITKIQRVPLRLLAPQQKCFGAQAAEFRWLSKPKLLMQPYSIHLRLHFQWIPFLFCSPLFKKNTNKNHYLLTTPTYSTAILVSFRAHLAPRWLRRVPIQQGGKKKKKKNQLTLIISINIISIFYYDHFYF